MSFEYVKTDFRYSAYWRNGKWSINSRCRDATISINEGSTVFHYGQEIFEGLKARMAKNGTILLFRPDKNADRMILGAERLMMPIKEFGDFKRMFIDACIDVVLANRRFIPPYGSGGSLYIRPMLFGCGENLGLHSAKEYMFRIFVSPVGAYFKDGFGRKIRLLVSKYDRAATHGTGNIKVGGNYAASYLPHDIAVKKGFDECLFVDSVYHSFVEEAGAANFFAINTRSGILVTPVSSSVLPGITIDSLIRLAPRVGLQPQRKIIPLDCLSDYDEAAACGTAAVITPIGEIRDSRRPYIFFRKGVEGSKTEELYNLLTAIQQGDTEAPEGWIVEL